MRSGSDEWSANGQRTERENKVAGNSPDRRDATSPREVFISFKPPLKLAVHWAFIARVVESINQIAVRTRFLT